MDPGEQPETLYIGDQPETQYIGDWPGGEQPETFDTQGGGAAGQAGGGRGEVREQRLEVPAGTSQCSGWP